MSRRAGWWCAAALSLLLGVPSSAAPKGTLRVYAAASLVDAFSALGHRFEAQHPGLSVRMSFAGTQQLAAQLEMGAEAEVFASADLPWMNDVKQHGLLAGEPVRFARNRMVVIVSATSPAHIESLQHLARRGVKLLLCTDAVPAGRYSRTVLRNLATDSAYGSDFAARALRNVVSEEENPRAVLAKIQLGEADAGIVYRSDVNTASLRFMRIIELPASANVLAEYPIAVLKSSADPKLAAAFVRLVCSPEGQQVLEQYGFMKLRSER